ncbi:SCO6745 family protein [Nocardia brasiliensis]|uniref:SalK n=1 Tax=Nocardia brasiliensis (strain ATCC 700358 / HUJEG-1) TaxID=1133849 RepID=K0EQP9_NOCB7|nr:hypothetical protein [Nocardia brasiliensis]AFT99139.1 hypothetical protein O3I_005885 [Nocardia brasiliensis ATCC 700358]OCF85036.1 hypothetical protein AW168_37990 [Nocardia brasiliensis]
MDSTDAGRCARALETIHSMTYFAPETEQYLVEAGLRPGRMCYFAGRAAPMGAVGPGVVAATFYNFNPDLVARHIPRAWSQATPEAVVTARLASVDAALRRLLGAAADSAEVREAAELARTAATACTAEGRPLHAAHADLPWPTEPLLVLWHAITLLREHRGDGHIAALLAAGLSGIEALITHTATGRGFTPLAAQQTRGWNEQQWTDAAAALRMRGLLTADDTLTEAGTQLRADVEAATNDMALAPWSALGDAGATRLAEIGKTLSRTIVAAGAFPPGVFTAATGRNG